MLWLIITYLFSQLIEIIFPRYCLGCNKMGTLLCNRCFETLPYLQFPVKPTKNSKLTSITVAFEYSGVIKSIIYEYKYRRVQMIATLIANLLYYCCSIPKSDYITFVPIHTSKLRRRGFNQSKEIAIVLGKLLHMPVISILEKNKKGVTQMTLKNKFERKKNLAGTLIFSKKVTKNELKLLNNSRILLVDDIYTTGSTLNYCAHLISEHTTATLSAICFAHKS